MMKLEDWALENAALLVAHVGRHGIAITWNEAHDQLLRSAPWLETPVYVDDGEVGLSPLAPAVPASESSDFVEEVAAGIVLDEGSQFFPVHPATAETPIAVPWALASELVHRLSVLLSERLMELRGTTADITLLVELSLLVSRLSGEVSAEMSCVLADGEGVCVIDDEPYPLMPACAVWQGGDAPARGRRTFGEGPTCGQRRLCRCRSHGPCSRRHLPLGPGLVARRD